MDRNASPSASRTLSRRQLLSGAAAGTAGMMIAGALPTMAAVPASPSTPPAAAATFDGRVATEWFDLMLRLIRGTPGYTPPVAARAIGCAGLGLYEAVVPGMPGYRSLAGELNDLRALPAAGRNTAYHWPSVANASLAAMMRGLFPTAPAALQDEINRLEARLVRRVPAGIRTRSVERGRAVASAINEWARTDGGHEGYTRNFPSSYQPPVGPGLWVPTPPGNQPAMQPTWGSNRCMALSSARDTDPGPPPAFSTDPTSRFFTEATEVMEAVNGLTADEEAFVRFWADDPVRTATPSGHSLSVLNQLLVADDASLADAAEAAALLGIAVCDAFIACWQTKYRYNLLRPITYIRAHLDPAWGNPLPVGTPPFPEYTSGHSVQSGAAAEVLTALFGIRRFTDHTHDALGLPARTFDSFDDMAEEAARSRLHGGIHYRSAIERGLAQGRSIGLTVASLPIRD
jgi:hypothetical protein